MTNYLDSLDTFNTTAGVKSESMLFLPLVDEIIADDEYAIMGLPINWILDQLSEFSWFDLFILEIIFLSSSGKSALNL